MIRLRQAQMQPRAAGRWPTGLYSHPAAAPPGERSATSLPGQCPADVVAVRTHALPDQQDEATGVLRAVVQADQRLVLRDDSFSRRVRKSRKVHFKASSPKKNDFFLEKNVEFLPSKE
jgi:hypothetical protein